jgi:hypothetical protein
MKAMSGKHSTWGGPDASRGCNNQKSRIDTLPGISIPGVKMETSHKYMHTTTLRSGFLQRLAVLATCLFVVLGLVTSSPAATATFTVSADEDDAVEIGSGGARWDNSADYYLRVVQASSNQKHVGHRFTNVTIPKNSTITSAYLKPYLYIAVNDDLYCKIYGEATNSSNDFSSNPTIVSRSRTTAYTAVSLDNQGEGWKSYNVTSAVQEIVNRSGWSSGNALTLLMIGNTNSTSKEAQYYSAGAGVGAQLVIDYTPPPTVDVYYSIGTSTSDLKTGNPTITIASGTATLTVPQTGNIGVGDVITYNTSRSRASRPSW